MMRRLLRGLLWGVIGYVAGALGGAALVSLLSTNPHDRSLEAVMTGAFVTGPIIALIGLLLGTLRAPGRGNNPA
jgi:hypothetical protein